MHLRAYLARHGSRIVKPSPRWTRWLFDKINRDAFEGAVPEPSKVILPDTADWHAQADLWDDKWHLGITREPMTVRSAADLIAHEMVHVHLFTIDGDRRTMHGPSFMAWAPALALHGIILKEKDYELDH